MTGRDEDEAKNSKRLNARINRLLVTAFVIGAILFVGAQATIRVWGEPNWIAGWLEEALMATLHGLQVYIAPIFALVVAAVVRDRTGRWLIAVPAGALTLVGLVFGIGWILTNVPGVDWRYSRAVGE